MFASLKISCKSKQELILTTYSQEKDLVLSYTSGTPFLHSY